MGAVVEPFAFELYRRYLEGESVEELSRALNIPRERVRMRIRAAAEYERRRGAQGAAPVWQHGLRIRWTL